MMKYKLEELFDLQMGKTPSRNNHDYWNVGDNKWISIGDLSSAGKYISDTKEYLSQLAVEESGIKSIPVNTVVMSFKLSIGKVAITAEDMYSNEAIMAFHDKKVTTLLPDYIYYLFLYQNWDAGTNKAVMGKTLNKATLSEFEVDIHSIDEQQRIVKTLDKISAIIENRRKQLEELNTLIKARFVEMFGNQWNNEKNFQYGKINDVAEIYLGLTHTPNYIGDGIKFISAKNTSGDYLDLSDVKYISREEFMQAPVGAKPRKGDVLFSRVGSNLGHPVILDTDEELCTFVSLGYLRTKGVVTNLYLKHWMCDDFFAEQVRQKVVGGGQPNLNTGWLKEFRIIIPPMELQEQFAAFVEQVNKLKANIQKSLDETQMLFDSLMQQYFG